MKSKILIVEDESDIASLLEIHLLRSGYDIQIAKTGVEALRYLSTSKTDLIILDWMLPEMSGIEVARDLRRRATEKHELQIPILMVTAKSEPSDIVWGLENGADDFITKPFDLAILTARVRALLRRTQESPPITNSLDPTLNHGPFRILLSRHEFYLNSELVELTPYEFKLLASLMEAQGRVLTRSKLIDCIQGSGIQVTDRTVDTLVFGLRKKLGTFENWIETVRGIGYRLKTEA